jgi:hypothetical protein
MLSIRSSAFLLLHLTSILLFSLSLEAQTGNSTSINGSVLDSSGAIIPGAVVEIHNPVSQFSRSTTSDGNGNFSIPNVPFNPYHFTVSVQGFASYAQDVEVRSLVPLNLKVTCRSRLPLKW